MSRFFLHLRFFSGEVVDDVEGTELPGLAAARAEALFAMQDFVAEAIKRGDDPPLEAIIVADEHGTHVTAVPVAAAVPSILVGIFKNPEKVIPPDRLQEYRGYADECRAKAENTDSTDDKVSSLCRQ